MKYLDSNGKNVSDVAIVKRWIKIPTESESITIPLNYEHHLVHPRVEQYISLLEDIIGESNLPKLKLET